MLRTWFDRKTVLAATTDLTARLARGGVAVSKDLALEAVAAFFGTRDWNTLSHMLPTGGKTAPSDAVTSAPAPVSAEPAPAAAPAPEVEAALPPVVAGSFHFRFRKGSDTPDTRDMVAVYLASMLAPDTWRVHNEVEGTPERYREVVGTLGWAAENSTREDKYQLGRSNDFWMFPADNQGTWRVAHRYFSNELMTGVRTVLLNRMKVVLEAAEDPDRR